MVEILAPNSFMNLKLPEYADSKLLASPRVDFREFGAESRERVYKGSRLHKVGEVPHQPERHNSES